MNNNSKNNLQKEYLNKVEMFYLNTIEQLFLFVEQLEVCLLSKIDTPLKAVISKICLLFMDKKS